MPESERQPHERNQRDQQQYPTGPAHSRRGKHSRKPSHGRGSAIAPLYVIVFGVVVVAVIAGWFGYRHFAAAPQQHPSVAQSVSSIAHAGPVDGSTEESATTTVAAATPIIASYKDVTFRLPVSTDDLTELALHQASYSYALHMTTPLKIADTNKVQKKHGTKRPAEQPHGEDAVLDGSILQLWRSGRKGKPDTALDVGAQPGDTLLSPVDGTVVLVKKYRLYKKWPDLEIHIQPTGHPELDVVMIHVTDPAIIAGDTVVAGVTEIGHLRQLSDKTYLQLAAYTAKKDEGNHTHIQINDATDRLYLKDKHLKGAITVAE